MKTRTTILDKIAEDIKIGNFDPLEDYVRETMEEKGEEYEFLDRERKYLLSKLS